MNHLAFAPRSTNDTRRTRIAAACLATLLCALPLAAGHPPWIIEGAHGVVASDSPQASQVGAEILQSGGNAFDAGAAVSFALGVARPYSTGLGGGGFMVARTRDGRVIVLDYREVAPSAATPDMFRTATERHPTMLPPSRYGGLAVAVPGTLAGWAHTLENLGTMNLKRVIAPAERIAREGFPADDHYVASAGNVLNTLNEVPSLRAQTSYLIETYLGGKDAIRTGQTITQPRLAMLLERIGAEGVEYFYNSEVAGAIESTCGKWGGIITAADLSAYRPVERDALIVNYRDLQLITMPPPSSGGIALAETLNILSTMDLAGVYRQDVAFARHLQVEAMKHAFADRARWLGDSDFAKVPVEHLTSMKYATELAERIRTSGPAKVESYGAAQLLDDAGTSHFCIVDRWGNIVSATETINTEFGSLVVVEEFGLILNNEMDDFTADPGQRNAYGLVQSQHNAVAPGKKPLSSMTPTIVLKRGEPFMALGASGGPRIISSVLNVFLAVVEFGLSPREAMLLERPHHQWTPDEIFFDRAPEAALKRALQERGHTVSDDRRTGIVQMIVRSGDGWLGLSDPRKGGQPAASNE